MRRLRPPHDGPRPRKRGRSQNSGLGRLALSLLSLGCSVGKEKISREEPKGAVGTTGPLEREFAGAYPTQAPTPTATRTFAFSAAVSDVQLFEGRILQSWAYDGTVPGPTLRLRLGETLRVEFRNELPDPTTIHWHGMRVPNAMDGVPGVTQPPIPPGEGFTYEFTPKDPGTFWFHPHVRGEEQVERGLYGVLIVDDPEPLPYTADVLWVLDDWRLTRDGQAIDPRFVTRGDLAHDGRWGQVIAVNGTLDERLEVAPGARIRLRLVDVANGRVFRPDWGPLNPEVIAVDGMYASRPLPVDGFELAPGNRLDLDLVIPPELAGQSIKIVDRFTRRPHHLATIVVGTTAVRTPEFPSPARAHVPRWVDAAAAPVDLTLALSAARGGPYGIRWMINGKTYDENHAEALVEGRWNKVRFANESPRLHPMHIHGQFFKVVARNGQAVDEPYWRDTVLLRPRETVDVGLVPLDAGKWALHCHILEHAAAGMMTLVHVRPGPATPHTPARSHPG